MDSCMVVESRSSVPKFGNWESEDGDGVPYTAYFDKARKTRGVGGKMINPNDPKDPDMFPSNDPSPLAHPSSNPPPQKSRAKPNEPIGTGPECRGRSKEDADFRHFSNSPARGDKTSNDPKDPDMFPSNDPSPLAHPSSNPPSQKSRIKPNESIGTGPERRGRSKEDADFRQFSNSPARGDETSKRRPEQGFERSPLHPQYHANVTGRNNGSPAWEGKNRDSSHGTPGRTRPKPTARGDDSPDRAAAVPKFGEWDVRNPEEENFTHIFNKVREERNTNAAGTPKHPSYGARPQQAKEPKKPSCFCW